MYRDNDRLGTSVQAVSPCIGCFCVACAVGSFSEFLQVQRAGHNESLGQYANKWFSWFDEWSAEQFLCDSPTQTSRERRFLPLHLAVQAIDNDVVILIISAIGAPDFAT